MDTGFCGTFVISWSQTDIDGVPDAALSALQVGATWSWRGEPVRVDGPSSVLQLRPAEDDRDIRGRAARMVRRLVGAALEKEQQGGEAATDDSFVGDSSFVVTDGHKGYTVTLIPVGRSVPPLLMFVDEIPPSGCDLWVVHHARPVDPIPLEGAQAGGVICFTHGTQILTPLGPVPVERLREGDLVQTKDSGAQPVCWSGQRRMSGARLFAMPSLRPIRLRAGAIGLGQPDMDILVSPEHRMLVKGAAARALFNTPEVLVAARDLVNGSSVTQDMGLREVTYVHLLLPRHEILIANGVETESFHPANTALSTLDTEDRLRLFRMVPEIVRNPQSYGDYARRNLSRSEAAILLHDAA